MSGRVMVRNRFREKLERGDFLVLGEFPLPGREMDKGVAFERIAAFEEAISRVEDISVSLALTEGGNSAEFFRSAEFIQALKPENRDRHLFYLSGRNCPEDLVPELMSRASAEGALNWVAVSGNAVPGEYGRRAGSRRFMESTAILRAIHKCGDSFFTGCTANPFQYSADSLFAQQVKWMRKIRCGAQFVVAQSNWDMLKLQAMRWYLNGRGYFIPSIARLMFLTPERMEWILDGRFPGIVISPDFRTILQKELRISRSQFEAAQWRRIELQAAGCRLLGYSGVQVAGLDKPEQLRLVASRIAGALREFPAFDGWLEAYNSYQARAEMAPFSGSFYLYDRGLNRIEPDRYPPEMRQPDPAVTCFGERFRSGAARLLFPHADRQPVASRKLLKQLVTGCPGRCPGCTLPQTMFVCARHCPKHLNGVCGGIRPDGSCEFPGVGECVHRKIMRLAREQGMERMLEEQLP